MSRPDYITCIRETHEDRKHLTWCGRSGVEFCFIGLDHAAYTHLTKRRLRACTECVAAAVKALQMDAFA